jgi:hypothetical protein
MKTHHANEVPAFERLNLIIFCLIAFSLLAVSSIFFALSIGKPFMGFTLARSAEGWNVQSVDPYGVARQAGVSEGDRPIEIDGQPAESILEEYGKSELVMNTGFKQLAVINQNGQVKVATLENGTLSWQGVFQQLAWLFVSLTFWIVGFYVFLKRPKTTASLLLCLIGLFFGLMLSSNMIWITGFSKAIYFQVIALTVGPWLFLHFFLVLPEERAWLNNRPWVYTVYIPPVITLILVPLIGFVNDQPVLWFLNLRYIEVSIAFLAAISVAIYNYIRARTLRTRQQMKILAIACFLALIPAALLFMFPEAIWKKSVFPSEYVILFLIFIPIGMGHAVVTQRLLDIDLVIRRSLIYGLVTVVMTAILAAGIFSVIIFQESLGVPEEILIALALGGIATALFGPAKNGIEKLVDKYFYKDRYDYRLIIQSLAASLNSVKDLTDISRMLVSTTVNTLNLSGGCLAIKGQTSSYEAITYQGVFSDADKRSRLLKLISEQSPAIAFPRSAINVSPDLGFIIPLRVGDAEIGFLCLSPKVTRQDFSSNDIFLLQGIASVAGIALHGAMLMRDANIRDTFISVASHELRTPLTSVMGYADLLLKRDSDEKIKKKWLKYIVENSQKLSDMVDDLLNVSRIRSGKVNIKLEEIGLTEALKEPFSFIKETTDKHDFILKMEPGLPDALVDRDKLGQVLRNLLSNAVKYSPKGGRVMLSASYDKKLRKIIVSVADEGMGISPEDKDLLFTTFHRIQRPETQGIRGSGLGLYIAKEWTQAMGGEIWLESELNKGSTFFLALPSVESKVAEFERSTSRTSHSHKLLS